MYFGGDAYSAPMVYVRDNNSDWVLYDIVRDWQGSITHLVDDSDGTVVAEYSYDPWGRMRDPQTLEIYTTVTAPELFLGRFLSPDPYVQAPDFSLNFNRYAYCLNNPLKYTDEDGENPIVAILIGAALLGGGVNVACNWDNIDGFWQGATTFISGAIAGVAVAAAGIYSKSVATSILVGIGGGALTSFNNSIVAQTGSNFSGWNSIDWDSVWKSTISGAVSGGITAGVGFSLFKTPININGFTISSPLLKSAIISPIVSAVGYISASTTYGVLDGQPFWDSFYSSFNKDLLKSMAMGSAIGIISTIAHCFYQGINPFTGDIAYPDNGGFIDGDPYDSTLRPGMIVDRYGNPEGNYLAPEGTPFEWRSLPPHYNDGLTKYMVLKPIPVSEGITAPSWWFNSPGGGTQYHLPKGMMKYYIENGYLIKD